MAEKVKIFISYSHKDIACKKTLESHLSLLLRNNNAEIWADHNIVAGQQWDKEIAENLKSSNMVLMLLSANFIESDYCYQKEMEDAIYRHKTGQACVIPILLENFYWQDPTFEMPFKDIQMIPIADGKPKPLTLWNPPDIGYTEITKGISQALFDLQKNLKVIKNRNVEERRKKIESMVSENKLDEASNELMDFISQFCKPDEPEVEPVTKELRTDSITLKGQCTFFSNLAKDPAKMPGNIFESLGNLMKSLLQLLEKAYSYLKTLIMGNDVKNEPAV